MEHVCLKSLADEERKKKSQTETHTKLKSFLRRNLKQTDVDRQTTSSSQGEET